MAAGHQQAGQVWCLFAPVTLGERLANDGPQCRKVLNSRAGPELCPLGGAGGVLSFGRQEAEGSPHAISAQGKKRTILLS